MGRSHFRPDSQKLNNNVGGEERGSPKLQNKK